MKTIINDEMNQVKEAVLLLDSEKDISPENDIEEGILMALEFVFDLSEKGLEQSRDICRIGAHQPLIDKFFTASTVSIKNKLSIIFNSILQNNDMCTEYFLKEDALNRLLTSLFAQTAPKELEVHINFLNGFMIGYNKGVYNTAVQKLPQLTKLLDKLKTEKSMRR